MAVTNLTKEKEALFRKTHNIGPGRELDYTDIRKYIGEGYDKFWQCTRRYRVVKGSRGSKKSCDTALWLITKMSKEKFKYANALVIRKSYNTHRDSTYAQLKWAIYRLHQESEWEFKVAPLRIIRKKTGQQIIFRGLDDPLSITSITVDYGVLCWVWWEEAFQITNEADFDKVDMSIRGVMPPGYFKQHTLTFNPWSDKIWLKRKFFDKPDADTLAITTNYKCNEWLDEADIRIFEKMRIENPKRYSVEGLGEWGISEGLVYDNWEIRDFDFKQLIRANINIYGKTIYKLRFGLDFGFTNDQTAFIACLVDEDKKEIYIFDEFYRTGMTNKMIAQQLKYMRYHREKIMADSAEPKSIEEIKQQGIRGIKGVKKGPDSIRGGIQKLRDYKIIVHPNCENTIIELSNYIWDTDKQTGKALNNPVDDYNHLMDALRYATIDIAGYTFGFD